MISKLLSAVMCCVFFFSSRRRHTRYWRDWSSDVCSSGQKSVQRQGHEEKSEQHRRRADDPAALQDLRVGRRRRDPLELAVRDEAGIFGGTLVPDLVQGQDARENHRVHRELLGPELPVEEVNREDENGGEKRFLAVNEERHVEEIAGQEASPEPREPADEARTADDPHYPEHGPVVEFFPVGEAVELGPRAPAYEPADVPDELLEILGPRHHRARTPEDAVVAVAEDPLQEAREVQAEREQHARGEDAMKEARRLEASHDAREPRGPRALGEEEREPREGEPEEARHEEDVERAVVPVEPPDPARRRHLGSLRGRSRGRLFGHHDSPFFFASVSRRAFTERGNQSTVWTPKKAKTPTSRIFMKSEVAQSSWLRPRSCVSACGSYFAKLAPTPG